MAWVWQTAQQTLQLVILLPLTEDNGRGWQIESTEPRLPAGSVLGEGEHLLLLCFCTELLLSLLKQICKHQNWKSIFFGLVIPKVVCGEKVKIYHTKTKTFKQVS